MLEKLSRSRALLAVATIATMIGIGLFQKVEASSTANATATSNSNIITSIGITMVTNLNFGDAAQSDPAKTMDPSTAPTGAGWAGTPARGSFSVTGQVSHAYSVSIAPASVTMITGAGGANQTIVVNAFTYYSLTAASTTSAALNAGGTDTLYLAGTQAAIGATQVAGTYVSPNITVTVTYM